MEKKSVLVSSFSQEFLIIGYVKIKYEVMLLYYIHTYRMPSRRVSGEE